MDLKAFFKSLLTDGYLKNNFKVLSLILKNLNDEESLLCKGLRNCTNCFLSNVCSYELYNKYQTTIEDQRALIKECIEERMAEYGVY